MTKKVTKNRVAIAMPISSFLPNLGGMEVGLHNIASRLANKGLRPIVIAPRPHVDRLKDIGWALPYEVEAFPNKIWSILYRLPWLGFLILDHFFSGLDRKYNFHFWHCTMGYPTGIALIHYARKKGDINYLIRCAGEDIQKNPAIGYGARLDAKIDKLVSDLLPQCPKLIAITNSVADEYRDLGVNEEHIYAIPNGVDIRRFSQEVDKSEVRKKFGIDQDSFCFIAVGRNHPKKNYRTLIQAAEILRNKTNKKFQVVIVGRGVLDLLPLVEELQLTKTVRLIDEIGQHGVLAGEMPDLPAVDLVNLYKSSDAFSFPSMMETFGISIVEAMAAGLPVLVGDAPGCRDIVRGGQDGLMAPPEDSSAFAMQMYNIVEQETLRSSLSVKSLKRAEDFSWDAIVDRYCELYELK